ncbi:MAG: Ig domain-containing protein, partial [Gammaproteobacteria bacterium]|nr:Ig domain-containing protein [Gammaproteobacteria bacterium]
LVPVTGVSLDRTALSLSVGQTSTLVATVAPANATGKHVTWASSNNAVAAVDITGQVRAVSPGTARITVTTVDGGFTAYCDIQVLPTAIPVTGVVLDRTAFSLNIGQTSKLVATVLPVDAPGKHVLWESSDDSIATVDITGEVRAISTGIARITVTTVDGGFTTYCDVQVRPSGVPVTGVTLDETAVKLNVGATQQLVATVQPADATGKHVTWASDNESIATVDITGEVQGVSPGTARITVTTLDGGFTAFCDVQVKSSVVPVTGVFLDKTNLFLNVAQSATLVATVLPENATGKEVNWTSSNNPVATVSRTGEVQAISPGTARITVTTVDGGFTDFCDVQVLPTVVPVTKVTLDQASITLFVGKKATLGATVWPLEATNKAVFWTTTNAAVAAIEEITASTPQNISSSAFIKGASAGTAKITVSTADGGFTAQCDVNVITDTGGATEGGCNTGAATSGIMEILLFSPFLLLLKKNK